MLVIEFSGGSIFFSVVLPKPLENYARPIGSSPQVGVENETLETATLKGKLF